MKRVGFFLFLLPFFLSCASEPQVIGHVPPEAEPEPAAVVVSPPVEVIEVIAEAPAEEAEDQPFDPGTISQELFDATMMEVQALIMNLNRIIRARNYDAWRSFLSDSYFELISSPVFLEERTEDLFRRNQIVASNMGRDPRLVPRTVLRTPRDFFEHIVVPARSNDRVDEIAFISADRVMAFTVDSRGNRLILYDLELINGSWKITY